MKRIEMSIIVWGVYLMTLGCSLIIIPVKTVNLFGYLSEEHLWIRFLGILSVVLGLFYLQIGRQRIFVLYKWKIIGHALGTICMLTFLFSGIADRRIAGTIAIEVAGCIWTLLTYRTNPTGAV